MRSISTDGRAALYAAQTSDLWLDLLTIEHSSIGTPIRLVANNQPVTSRSETYLPFPFELALPSTGQESVDFVIDNVTRELVDEIRSIDTPLAIKLERVRVADPDFVEIGPFDFQSRAVEYDVQRMRFRITYEPLLNEPFPYDTYTPIKYPGLFQAVDR